jgi:hypothetical protein
MDFHQLGHPTDVGIRHDPTPVQRSDVDLPLMIAKLAGQGSGGEFGARRDRRDHRAACRLHQLDMPLQRAHAAHIGRHHRADGNDGDGDNRQRDQYLDDREA